MKGSSSKIAGARGGSLHSFSPSSWAQAWRRRYTMMDRLNRSLSPCKWRTKGASAYWLLAGPVPVDELGQVVEPEK